MKLIRKGNIFDILLNESFANPALTGPCKAGNSSLVRHSNKIIIHSQNPTRPVHGKTGCIT